MFHPGETITHRFVIPFAYTEIAKVIVTYKQSDHIIMEKEITSGFTKEGDHSTGLSFVFSQSESLMFQDYSFDEPYRMCDKNKPLYIQLNVYTTGGSRHTSNLIKTSTGIQYYREGMSA